MRLFLDEWRLREVRGAVGRFFGASPLTSHSARFYRAAVAEFGVAELVGRLGEGWYVVHGVSLRGGDGSSREGPRDEVSHVVIGERGVFAFTVVNPEGGSVWVSGSAFVLDGERRAHLRDAEFNALRLSQRIFERSGRRAEVVPAVVVANPRRLIVDKRPQRVGLVRPSEIRSWVEANPVSLTPVEAELIARVASAIALASDSEPFAEVFEEFGVVHTEVERASRRRVGWLAAGLVVAWFCLVALTSLV